ncbi:MAG: hypothetical protein AW07_03570 [Candidatus Accumulibacter sp. SK-11]|nr:MAG: hypothetical protein AW07_03570 [Candidatus Accumulibacter sp. SK-11]
MAGREGPLQRRPEFGERSCARRRRRPEQQLGQLRPRCTGLLQQRLRHLARLVQCLAQRALFRRQPLQQLALLPQGSRQRPHQLRTFLVADRRLHLRQQLLDHRIGIFEPVQGTLDRQLGIAGRGEEFHAALLAGLRLLDGRQAAQILAQCLRKLLSERLHAGPTLDPAHPLFEIDALPAQVGKRLGRFTDRVHGLGNAGQDLVIPVGDGAQRIDRLRQAGARQQRAQPGEEQTHDAAPRRVVGLTPAARHDPAAAAARHPPAWQRRRHALGPLQDRSLADRRAARCAGDCLTAAAGWLCITGRRPSGTARRCRSGRSRCPSATRRLCWRRT